MILQLTKQSTDQEIKAYFEEVLRLTRDSEEFPVNLDDVWPLVFGRKEEAVRALKNDRLFVEDIDYQVLRRNAENSDSFPQRCAKPQGGRPTNIYMLSVPCLEFFIARKVRAVFEVYRQVFHKVASGEITYPAPVYSKPCDLETSLRPLRDYTDEIYQRWKRLFDLSNRSDRVKKEYNNWITTYTNLCYYTSQMVYLETMAKLEGNHFLR
jgi:hypothetical protein